MDKTDMMAGIRHFLKDIVRFEKKKMILPCLAVLVVLSGVLLGTQTMSQYERATNGFVDVVTASGAASIEATEFNNSLESSYQGRVGESNEYISGMIDNRSVKIHMALLGAVYYTPFFPVAPGGEIPEGVMSMESSKALLFSSEKGYYLLDEYPTSLAVVYYRFEALDELRDRANRTDMTLYDFRHEVEEIKSHGPQSEEVRSAVQQIEFEEEGSTGFDTNMVGGMGMEITESSVMAMEHAVNDEVKEIGLVHFIPAMIVTFAWNYLLSGLIVAVFRLLKRSALKLSSKEKSSKNTQQNKQLNQLADAGNGQVNQHQREARNNSQYNNQQGQKRRSSQNNQQRNSESFGNTREK